MMYHVVVWYSMVCYAILKHRNGNQFQKKEPKRKK